MVRFRSNGWACVLAILLALAAVPAFAQTDVTTSRISGTVEDASGAPLPGVTIEATNTETGLVQVAVTDEQGFFRVLNLPTGTYTITATLDGFATATAPNVRLLLGSTPTVNFNLQSATISETITVTAEELPVVEVTNTTASTTIQQEQIENLPSSGRDFKQLVLLTPESRLESERGNLSLSGERGINTSITVDGMDYNNAFFGGAVGGAEGRAPLSISQESIKEFSVVTNGASVEYGRSGGGFVNIVTKSGTNNLHGSAFYFNQPQSLISDFPTVGATPGREANDQEKEQFGGSLGGAIVRDKLFYFVSYDNQDKSETVPILAANLPADVFAKWPVLASSPEYVQTQDGSVAFGRVDYQANPAHRFMLRANFIDYEGINGSSNSQSRTESYNGVEGLDTKAYVGSWSGQFGSNLLNDVNINYIDEETPRDDKGLNLPEIQVGGSRYGEVAFLPIQTTNERKAIQRHSHLSARPARLQGRLRLQRDQRRPGLPGQLARRLHLRQQHRAHQRPLARVPPVRRPGRPQLDRGRHRGLRAEGDRVLPAGPVVHPVEPDPERGPPRRDPGQPGRPDPQSQRSRAERHAAVERPDPGFREPALSPPGPLLGSGRQDRRPPLRRPLLEPHPGAAVGAAVHVERHPGGAAHYHLHAEQLRRLHLAADAPAGPELGARMGSGRRRARQLQ